jgi:Spirocyclase AveC-like
MATAASPRPASLHTPDPIVGTSRRPAWGASQYLALAAVPLLAYQAWTLVSWLASGPHEVTAYQQTASASYEAAWVIQIALIIGVSTLVVLLVRQCRRERRLTFDAVLFIALATTVFWDTVVNFVQPVWFYSTNWVNLNAWWGHAPFILNRDAGQVPFPVLALGLTYPFFVLNARILCRIMRAAENRWPGISKVRLILVCLGPALLIGALYSMSNVLTHLWDGPGMPFPILHGSHYWSTGEFLYIGIWSTTIASLRYFTDDHGRTLTERAPAHYGQRRRTTVRVLATIAFCNLSVIVWSAPLIFTGLYAKPYPTLPRSLSNVACNTPGTTGSHYGPCPGSPGYALKVR